MFQTYLKILELSIRAYYDKDRKKKTNSQTERYGPYTTVYDYFTTHKRTVYDRNIERRNTDLA